MDDLPRVPFAQSPLLTLSVAICAGVALAHSFPFQSSAPLVIAFVISASLTLFAIKFLTTNKTTLASVFLVAAFFCAGFALAAIDERSSQSNRLARFYEDGVISAGDPVELTGTVVGQLEVAPDGFYLTVKAESIRLRSIDREVTGTVLLLAHAHEQQVKDEYQRLELRHGARVRVMTTLDREESFRNPGVLPFTEYLDRKGYDATGVIKSPLLVERLDDSRVFLPLAWLYQWRERLSHEFAARFSNETAGVLDAALLGNRYNVSHAAADRFRAGGTFHVLVIAGLHIGFIGGVVFLLVRWLTKNRLLQFLCAATFLWAYAIAVGAHPPVVRAALVFTLVVFAPLVWRRANSLNVIGGAALALLVWRPNELFDPSFQLTFLSVLAIVSLAAPAIQKMQQVGSWRPAHETPYPPDCPRWFRIVSEALFWSDREWQAEIAASNISYRLFKTPIASKLEKWQLQRLLRFAAAAIVVSASVQLGMMPLLIIYFHRLSIASVLLNIFVGGLMALLAFIALAGVLVTHLSAWLGAPLIMLAEKVNWLMIHLVDPFTRLGLASIRLPHYSGWMAGVYGLYYVPLGFLVLALALWNPLRPASITNRKRHISPKRFRVVVIAISAVLSIIVLHPFSAARPDGKLHVDFLDVGQGDSALLTMPDGTTLLIDGGGRPNIDWNTDDDGADESFQRDTRSIGEGVVSEFLWARGLDQVDYILPTHADADHIDGLNDVARNFKVRGAIVARTPADDREYVRFAATMKGTGVPIEKIGAGDILRCGNVIVEVLWPQPTADTNAPSRNNDGLVLRVRFGDKAFLFTADIEKLAEAGILREGVDLRSDVIKVAHHGSRTSSTETLVAATRPSIAIISVGRTSIFGHPNKEVVDRWRASGAEVMTTGQRGTITIVTDGKELKVSSFVPR